MSAQVQYARGGGSLFGVVAEYPNPGALLHALDLADTPDRVVLTVRDAEGATREQIVRATGEFPTAPLGRNFPFPADWVTVFETAESVPMYLRDLRTPFWYETLPDLDAVYLQINAVRNRAGLGNITTSAYPELLSTIESERRLEFAFEGQRWFDLVRTGRLVQNLKAVGKTNVQEKHYLYPIPQREIDLNPKLEQNPGW